MATVVSLFPALDPEYRTRVYFGLAVYPTQVKIGLTGRSSGRRGGEMHFDELCCVSGDRAIEQMYHDRYAAERIGRTEWFHLSDRLLLDLYAMCVKQGRDRSARILRGLILARLGQKVAA